MNCWFYRVPPLPSHLKVSPLWPVPILDLSFWGRTHFCSSLDTERNRPFILVVFISMLLQLGIISFCRSQRLSSHFHFSPLQMSSQMSYEFSAINSIWHFILQRHHLAEKTGRSMARELEPMEAKRFPTSYCTLYQFPSFGRSLYGPLFTVRLREYLLS